MSAHRFIIVAPDSSNKLYWFTATSNQKFTADWCAQLSIPLPPPCIVVRIFQCKSAPSAGLADVPSVLAATCAPTDVR